MDAGKSRDEVAYADFHEILVQEFKKQSSSLWFGFKVSPDTSGLGPHALALANRAQMLYFSY